ncbi:serine hydrolase domain-containing protein [Micromonospora sp. C28SCA-DRY-2]|uniref:serine hydrolase domain-containing protein n=1 Tax=Micromonospora sp. C28SCA-DRY-2 TaxID=3059522 RepID=UPI002677476E|nr:serine hydrolase domain-containing protein [Micromonospora sp. C28SCA-DRY-2]MDO3702893.1 serine hydrolase domain-containing protein [Micromonospora sp. C28SCA-DRY-2]
MRRWSRPAATVLIAVACLGATGVIPARAAEDDTTRVRTYLDRYRDANHIPGLAVAVVRGDRVVQEHVLGLTGDGTPVTAQTPFLLGSVSKPFTALTVLQLAEAGRINLDAPARDYLPWLRLNGAEETARVTVRQLLTHTSGLPEVATIGLTDRFDNTEGGLARSVRDLAGVPLAGPPGAGHRYSDANYMILGALVEEVTGETFARHLRRAVLEPLGMRRTAATAGEAEQVRLPAGHRRYLGRPQRFDPPYDTSGVPYGYLASSLADLGHFAVAQLDGGRYGSAQVLSAGGVEQMHRGHAPISSGGRYALGWRDTALDGGATRLVWHAGATPGYFTHLVLVPGSELAVIVLANLYHPAADPALASAGFDIVRILLGAAPAPAENDTLLLSIAPVLFGFAGLLLLVLAATLVRAVRRHRTGSVRAGPGGLPQQLRRSRPGVRALVVAAGWAALAGAALGVLPRFVGGLDTLLLWAPDAGHAVLAVAALAGALALVTVASALAGAASRTPRPAASARPGGRTLPAPVNGP